MEIEKDVNKLATEIKQYLLKCGYSEKEAEELIEIMLKKG